MRRVPVPQRAVCGVQSNVSKLLSKEMQELMLQQSIYVEECAALAKHLESTDDAALTTALEQVDTYWAQLLAAVDNVKNGLGFFMLFNSMHAPPSHWIWYLLGGIKVSFVVRVPASVALNLVLPQGRQGVVRGACPLPLACRLPCVVRTAIVLALITRMPTHTSPELTVDSGASAIANCLPPCNEVPPPAHLAAVTAEHHRPRAGAHVPSAQQPSPRDRGRHAGVARPLRRGLGFPRGDPRAGQGAPPQQAPRRMHHAGPAAAERRGNRHHAPAARAPRHAVGAARQRRLAPPADHGGAPQGAHAAADVPAACCPGAIARAVPFALSLPLPFTYSRSATSA